ncbi:MAG TPA: winged helix-turn-helix transcriptional regulator [Mycobacteriales bacterium]|nr:winged helix-turn-helix transcriptional regulator [Mycobacteriales bacterium]
MKSAVATVSTGDRRTRERVAQSLLEHGPSTAAELADRLGLTPAGIRRHLDAALADGTIVARDERPHGPRGRGRPARRFALSDAGHSKGPTAYDQLAVDALQYLRELGGDEAVSDFARRRIADWEARYAEQIGSLPLDQRPAALADALAADGYASTVHGTEFTGTHGTTLGVQVCQHHCPVQHVAEQFPVLCEVETEAIGRLVGRHVQRLATMARGDRACTTFIPLTDISHNTGRTHP